MTEEPELDREEQEVRRLLAGAAPSAEESRTPDGVAARLDDVLADLVAARTREEHAGIADADTPSPTARARRWPQLLAAAAAVTVIGLGLGNLVHDIGGETENAMTSQAPAADSAGAEAQERRQSAGPDGLSPAGGAVALSTGSFPAQAQRIEDQSLAASVDRTRPEWARACVRPATHAGDEWLPVRFDGEPAVLLLRAPSAGRRTAEVFRCGDPHSPAASATIDVRAGGR